MKGYPTSSNYPERPDQPHGDAVTCGALTTAHMDDTWDVADFETGTHYSDWEIKLSLPRTSPSHDEQFG
eukprot:7692250-Prorocentrum_lima.AAC.1